MALKPTNNPLDVMRREQAQLTRETQSAFDAGGTQPFQAVRKLQAQIAELRDVIIRMPWNDGDQVDVTSWGTASPPVQWVTVASMTIPRPEDKTRAVVSARGFITAIASGSALAFRSRLVINGEPSVFFDGSVEGSAITRSVSYPSFVREIAGLVAPVSVQLQTNDVSGMYEFDQRASLSVTVAFSTV